MPERLRFGFLFCRFSFHFSFFAFYFRNVSILSWIFSSVLTAERLNRLPGKQRIKEKAMKNKKKRQPFRNHFQHIIILTNAYCILLDHKNEIIKQNEIKYSCYISFSPCVPYADVCLCVASIRKQVSEMKICVSVYFSVDVCAKKGQQFSLQNVCCFRFFGLHYSDGFFALRIVFNRT